MTKYTRAPDKVKSAIVETNGQVIINSPATIHIPTRFSANAVQLCQIGETVFSYALFPVILTETKEYSILNVTSIVEMIPSKVSKITIDTVEYHELIFDAGDVLIKTTDVVRRDSIIFNILDELIFNGKIPWYIDYEDLSKIFDTAETFAKSRVGQNLEVVELLASMVSRSKKDRNKYIREVGQSYDDFKASNIDYTPMESVLYSVKSVLNKVSGSYFTHGINSALINKSTKVDKIEQILRA